MQDRLPKMEHFDMPTSTHWKASAVNAKESSSATSSASGKNGAIKTPYASCKRGPDQKQ